MRDLNNLPDLELALIQTTLVWQDADANRERFAGLLDQARGADLIVLPEMFTTGFSMDSAALAEPEEGATYAWLRGQAARLDAVVGWRVRPLICYDLRFPVWSRDPHGTDLLLYTANWPAARRDAWNRLLPARAIENLCYVAAVNRVGEDGKGYPYSGDSQVLDFKGDTLLDAGDRDGVFRCSLRARDLAAFRERFPAYHDGDEFELKL